MGHLRYGRLYKTRKWSEVIGLLESNIDNIPEISRLTLKAADRQIAKLGSEPILGYCFWLLSRLTWASRSDDFTNQLKELGITPESTSSTFTFISNLTDIIRRKITEHPESGIFGEIASLSFRQALVETIAKHSQTLFGTTLEDIQSACRVYSSKTQFSILSRRFFTHFLSRSLAYFINKELSNHIGPERQLDNIQSAKNFNDSLIQHAYESTKILEDFAGGWYSKHNWESRGYISEEEVRKFVAFALKKLRMELEREGELA